MTQLERTIQGGEVDLHVILEKHYPIILSFRPSTGIIFINIFCPNQSQFWQACYIGYLKNPVV